MATFNSMDTSNDDMNLLVMDDLLPSGQRSIVDEEILALSQANSFGQLEEKKVGAVKIYLQKKNNKEVLEGHLKMSKIYAQIKHDSESWRMFLQKEDAVRSAHNVYSSINDSEESLKLNEEEWLRRGFAEYRSKVLKKLNIRSMIQQRAHKAEWMIDLLKHPELLQQNNEEENLKIKKNCFCLPINTIL
ncbi:uncharacterized protein LOC136027914 isoform X2 [Artemia franciscana]|uniref:uncharacterized protein LOC136027914 isoform X2 n=1 Tax=Artemia franciscana TaxID=6661 RepID=UPI0032DA825A